MITCTLSLISPRLELHRTGPMHQVVMEVGRLAPLLLGVATAVLTVAADLSGPSGQALTRRRPY